MKVLLIFVIASIVVHAALARYYGHDQQDYHTVPHYQFEYGVHDPHSHDVKTQHEHREHDNVIGGYSLKEPDGTQRIVEYTSHPHEGFKAVVRRIGHAQHPAVYGHGHGGNGGYYGGGAGGTSYVGVTHWGHGSGR